MLIDQMLVFSDNVAVHAEDVSGTVDGMPFIGKGNEVAVSVCVTEAYPASATLAITVQESPDGETFTECGVVSAPAEAMTQGGVFSFSLPKATRGPKVRLAYAVAGNPSTGKLWAGIARDTLEAMEKGQYANAGKAAL